MKLFGFLTYTAFVLVVGAACAWLVLGKDDPNCTLVAASYETTQDLYEQNLATARYTIYTLQNLAAAKDRKIQSLRVRLADAGDFREVAAEVKELKALVAKAVPVETEAKWQANFMGMPINKNDIRMGIMRLMQGVR